MSSFFDHLIFDRQSKMALKSWLIFKKASFGFSHYGLWVGGKGGSSAISKMEMRRFAAR